MLRSNVCGCGTCLQKLVTPDQVIIFPHCALYTIVLHVWSYKHTPVIVYQSLCRNVSKSLKKVQTVRLQFSSVHINITEENNMPRSSVWDRGKAKVPHSVWSQRQHLPLV